MLSKPGRYVITSWTLPDTENHYCHMPGLGKEGGKAAFNLGATVV